MATQCVRLFITNYADLDLIANYDVSSEQAAFPVTNAFSKTRRSLVWRSNGYFNVTSANNQIVFRDDTSVDKTATITVAEYNSTTTFMAAVDAALEAVGVSNYTVTQNANFKFVIASNLSGGATAFQLRADDVDFTAADLLGFDTVAFTGASSYTADEIRIHGGSQSEFIQLDFGLGSLPNGLIIIGPRNTPIKISPNATVRLRMNETNNFTAPTFDQTLTYDDESIILLADDSLSPMALRYARIDISDQNPNGFVEIGGFFIGRYEEFARAYVEFPLQSNKVDKTDTVFAESGVSFSDIGPKTEKFTLRWKALTKEDKEQLADIFEEVGTGIPFYISIDSGAVFSTSANRFAKLVKWTDEPQFELSSANYYNMTMTLEEQL